MNEHITCIIHIIHILISITLSIILSIMSIILGIIPGIMSTLSGQSISNDGRLVLPTCYSCCQLRKKQLFASKKLLNINSLQH